MTRTGLGAIGALRVALLGVALSAVAVPAAFAETPANQLVIGTSLAQLLSLDPHQGQEPGAQEIIANIYDRLVATNNDGKVLPQLAESWEADDKGITFHLVKDAKFASGNPVTSEDVVYSIVRLIKMNQAAAMKMTAAGYTKDNVESMVHAVDAHTFRIDLSDVITADYLLYRLALGNTSIVDSVEVKKHDAGDNGNEWLRTHSAGSGPFTLSRWSPNEIVILEANPDYFAGAPKMRRVIMRHVPESQVERLMLERGDIDIANALTATDLASFKDRDGFAIQKVPTGGFYVLAMNAGREALSKPEVREAIAYGIDYDGIEKAVMGLYGRARTIPVPANYDCVVKDLGWSYQPEKAKELLKQAGYGDGLSLTLKTIAQTPRVDLATAIQASLKKVGIDISVQQGNGPDIISDHRARNFDLLMPQTGSYMPNVIGTMEQFSTNPDNSKEANNAGNFVWRSDWDIPELTKLTAEATLEKDPAKRCDMLKQMQQMFFDLKPAVLPMFERFNPIVLSDRVENYVGHSMQSTRLENVTKSD
ncbi:ABC transporter substrate-binding protein [Consotaella salsifontis]|uniref:Peptide/nickel transport system substrate-binding protein n=1 Tax=Consotaella salsifontis TaxID=1365950 RepID=A0A1T4RMV5_9HYPH|nr:ABC transporter substrate-binding protein [Consotaella salsifontis]SKA17011.1 peptide/nickel transport system substrate-binding protein [Consotaella salsifontis]